MPIFLQLKRCKLGNKSQPERIEGNVELACQELKSPAKILVAGKTRLHKKLLLILFGGVSTRAQALVQSFLEFCRLKVLPQQK